MVQGVNTMTFVAPNLAWGEARGGSIPRQWGCDRRATKPQAKFGATLRAAVLFGPGGVARSLQIHEGYARRSRLAWAENSSPQTSPYLRPGPPRWPGLASGACHFFPHPTQGNPMTARLKVKGNESFQIWGFEPVQLIKMLMMPISFVCSRRSPGGSISNAGDKEK